MKRQVGKSAKKKKKKERECSNLNHVMGQ